MSDLSEGPCPVCRADTPLLPEDKLREHLCSLPGWSVGTYRGERGILRRFQFKDFEGAALFMNRVMELATKEGHHPGLELFWYRNVIVFFTSRATRGITQADVIMSAKVMKLFSS